MKQYYFPLTTLAAALLAAYAQMAQAAEDDVTQLIKPDESSISIGVGSWSDRRMHEGMYDGMWNNTGYGSIDGNILKRDDATGTWTSLEFKNLGMDTVEFGAKYEKQGDWGVGLDYSQTPRHNPYTINTGLKGIGTERQTVTAVTPGAGRETLLDMKREATTLNILKFFSPSLEFRVNFKNEEKDGNRQWGVRNYPTLGSTAGSYPAFIAEPINSTTRQIDAVLSYGGEKLALTGGYYGSWYDNHNTRLDVIGTAGGVTEMSLPPDNEAHQGYVQGSYAFTPTTRSTFKVAYTHAMQNDPFISTTNNGVAAWAPTATVGASLQGEVNTTDAMLGLTSKLSQNLSLLADLRYWERKDLTPVRIDAGTTYHNNPFQSTKSSGKLEGTYRLPDGYSVTLGVDQVNQKRAIPEQIVKTVELFVPYRSTLDETTYRFNVRRSLSDQLNGSLGYANSTRRGSAYDAVNTSVDSATITPFYIADRNRDTVKLALDWAPTDALGLQFSFSDAVDKYPKDGVRGDGVREGKAQVWAVDGDYVLSDNWQINAWYSYDTNNIFQVAPCVTGTAVTCTATEWDGNVNSAGDSFGLGLRGQATAKLEVGFNFDWTHTVSKYDQSGGVPLLGNVKLPNITNDITRFHLFGRYAVQKNSSLQVDLIHESWKTDDWSWAFNNGTSFSYATEGTQVINQLNQTSSFAGIRYSYKFQ